MTVTVKAGIDNFEGTLNLDLPDGWSTTPAERRTARTTAVRSQSTAQLSCSPTLGGARGQASDIEITAREIQKLKKELYDIIATHSGQTYDKVWGDSDRDYWMIAEEAKEYGMIDEVLVRS